MATPIVYRESLRRRHRLLGSYLALWAWKRGVDCVVLPRAQLLSYLDLDHMRDDRVEWLKSDLKHMFRHAWNTVDSQSNVFATLYLSRRRFPQDVLIGSMTDETRIERMKARGLRAAIAKIPSEIDLIRKLSFLAHGIGKLRTESNA